MIGGTRRAPRHIVLTTSTCVCVRTLSLVQSGSGKTATTRFLLKYLVWRGSPVSTDTDGAGAEKIHSSIMGTNPILEA